VASVSSICRQAFKSPPGDIRCRHCGSQSDASSEAHQQVARLTQRLHIANRKLQERDAELEALRKAKTEKYVPPWASEARLRHHQFSARIIALCCCLAVVIGFRAVPKVLKIINRCLELDIPVPSRDAVRHWNCRNGVAILREPKKSTGWIWMIDHSVQPGKMCVLVVLGIHKDNIPRDRPLKRSDMTVLAVSPAPSRNKAEVTKQLQAVVQKFGHPFATICDGACELREAVATLKNAEFSGICLHDTKHRIAARLKINLGRSERWIAFEGKVGSSIAQLQQTELDHLMPPARKQKCRFMNLHRIVKWSTDILNSLRAVNCPARVREKLAWVEGFKTEITEWSQACEMIDRTLKQANEKGGSEGASAALRIELSKLPACSRWVKNMRTELIRIVADNESKLKAFGIPELVLPASTEVLESAFGSFKAIQRTHCRGTLTSLLATFATLFDQCTPEKIRERFRRVGCRELREWITAAGLRDSTQTRRMRSASESRQKQSIIQV
jgi:hypothetical protein